MSRSATSLDLIPEPCRVLGTSLKPFSLGHHLLLSKAESMFADFRYNLNNDEQKEAAMAFAFKATEYDLALAVFICAAPYSETYAEIMDDKWVKSFKSWIKKLKPRWYQKNRFDYKTEIAKFTEYIATGYMRPPVWSYDAAGGVQISSTWEELLKCRLVGNGFSESEILEKYLPAAWYDYFTVLEIKQAQECADANKWRKVFYTSEDAEKLSVVK
jgi:hypothetical protein